MDLSWINRDQLQIEHFILELFPESNIDSRCKFKVGNAISTRRTISKGKMNETQCIESCLGRRREGMVVDAVTMWSVMHNNKSECTCHVNTTAKLVADGNYKTCFLKIT